MTLGQNWFKSSAKYSSFTNLRSSLVDEACGLEKNPAPFTPNFTKRIQVLVSFKIWNPSSQRAWFQRNCLSHSSLAVNLSVRSLSENSSRSSHSPCTLASALLGLPRPAPKPNCKTLHLSRQDVCKWRLLHTVVLNARMQRAVNRYHTTSGSPNCPTESAEVADGRVHRVTRDARAPFTR